MYSVVVAVHSLLRWVVLFVGLAAAGRGIAGWSGRRWTPADTRAGLGFIIVLDLQFVVGLALYLVFSPAMSDAMRNVGAAMRDPILRFFLVEHVLGMVLAIACAHIGRAKIRKAGDDRRRQRLAAVFYSVAMILILLSIPWPGMPAGRPLWP
jgi:hypothetical protein